MNDRNLSKVKNFFKIVGATLVAVVSIALIVGLAKRGVGFYWFLVSPLLGIAFYLLAPRSWLISRVLMPIFPVANELIHRQEQVEQNISVVEKTGHTLRFYELFDIDEDQPFRDGLINALPDVNTDEGRVLNCAQLVAEHLHDSHPYLNRKLVELLYWERNSPSTAVLWAREREQFAGGLAEILYKHSRLLNSRNNLTFQQGDFETLLRALPAYTFDQVEQQLEAVTEICHSLRGYLLFLHEHGVPHKMQQPSPGYLLENYLSPDDLPLNPKVLDETILRVLSDIGRQTIHTGFRRLTKTLLDSFCRVSLILFLIGKPTMKAAVCRKAAEDQSVLRIAFAYLEFSEDLHTEFELGGKKFVSIGYLIRNWAKKVKEKERTLLGFQNEINNIQETLRKGEWVSFLSYMIQETFEKVRAMSNVTQKIYSLVAERPCIEESLRRVFNGLTLETVERFLEAKAINAYLLTFTTKSGSVARLLNCIVSADKQAELVAMGLSLQVNNLPKYNYKQYTDNGRIGVVPKGWTFERFYQSFQEDFLKVIDSRRTLVPKDEWDWEKRDLEKMELIVHRFGLSGRNYYGFISPVTQAYAIQKIQELFAGILDAHDLLALINYEKDEVNIPAAIIDGPIVELISDQIELTEDERKVMESRDQLLRSGILDALRRKSIQDLGRYLLRKDKGQMEELSKKTGKQLCLLLAGGTLEFDQLRCEVIAEAYLDTLRAIAGIA